jgi:hypothetical protein
MFHAGSFSRSAVNHESGAKTGLSGIVTGIIMGCALLFLTPLFEYIPQVCFHFNAFLFSVRLQSVLLIDSWFEHHSLDYRYFFYGTQGLGSWTFYKTWYDTFTTVFCFCCSLVLYTFTFQTLRSAIIVMLTGRFVVPSISVCSCRHRSLCCNGSGEYYIIPYQGCLHHQLAVIARQLNLQGI